MTFPRLPSCSKAKTPPTWTYVPDPHNDRGTLRLECLDCPDKCSLSTTVAQVEVIAHDNIRAQINKLADEWNEKHQSDKTLPNLS